MPVRKKLIRDIIALSFSFSIVLITIPHRLMNHFRGHEHIPHIGIDDLIPLVNWFVYPYLFWFVFVAAILVIMALFHRKEYFQLLISLLLGTTVCLIIFYLYPTTVPRPPVTGSDFTSQVVRFVYTHDQPYDCLPSLHVLHAVLAAMFFVKSSRNMTGKVFTIVSCTVICLSTLFLKQHYVMDGFIAVLIAIPAYLITSTEYIASRWIGLAGKKEKGESL
jgi:hypothetical protein